MLDQKKNCGEYFTQYSLENLKVKFQIDRLIDDNKILKFFIFLPQNKPLIFKNLRTETNFSRGKPENFELYIKAQLFNNQPPILPLKTAKLQKVIFFFGKDK